MIESIRQCDSIGRRLNDDDEPIHFSRVGQSLRIVLRLSRRLNGNTMMPHEAIQDLNIGHGLLDLCGAEPCLLGGTAGLSCLTDCHVYSLMHLDSYCCKTFWCPFIWFRFCRHQLRLLALLGQRFLFLVLKVPL